MSTVSCAMRRRGSGAMNASVRMLCSRSASFTSSTRTSDAIASRSLRKFSACAACLETRSSFLSLVSPSTRAPISGRQLADLGECALVSSMVSCRSAATMVASST